ncbi:MAG: amino acid--tRNA ligase-related protein, partial [Candidatus Thorarchaeota archaeon]
MVMEPVPHRQLSSEVAADVKRGVRFRYRSIRSSRAQAILRVQHQLSRTCRQILDQLGFLEVLAPIIGPVTDPGIRGAD